MRDSSICGPRGALADGDDEAAQPLAVHVLLPRHLLGLRQHALDRAEVDEHGARVRALLDDPADDVALAARELAEHVLVLDVAQPLEDDLPRRRGGDPAEPLGVSSYSRSVPSSCSRGPRRHVPGLAVQLDPGARLAPSVRW